MKFILTFTLPPEARDEAIIRFLETGGQPPPGVTLLGRWTQLDLSGGVAVLESEDPHALTAFAHRWSDLLELTLAPVLEDQELSDVLQRARHPSASEAAHAADTPRRPTRKTHPWRRRRHPGRPNRPTKNWRERTRSPRGVFQCQDG
jgi:hypothetical protein